MLMLTVPELLILMLILLLGLVNLDGGYEGLVLQTQCERTNVVSHQNYTQCPNKKSPNICKSSGKNAGKLVLVEYVESGQNLINSNEVD